LPTRATVLPAGIEKLTEPNTSESGRIWYVNFTFSKTMSGSVWPSWRAAGSSSGMSGDVSMISKTRLPEEAETIRVLNMLFICLTEVCIICQ